MRHAHNLCAVSILRLFIPALAFVALAPSAFAQQPFNKSEFMARRAKLFEKGGLSAAEFGRLNLGRNFEPMTLDEMRAVNPTAFKRAGL